MKVFFDNCQPAPAGWRKITWSQDAIALLMTGSVKQISFGDLPTRQKRGTSSDVLNWMERAVKERGLIPPTIKVHATNERQKKNLETKAARIENCYRRCY